MKRIYILKFILICLCSIFVLIAKNQTGVADRTISGAVETTKTPEIDKWFY